MEYIGVHMVDLPHSVKGFTKKNDDGSYTILINARLNAETQIEAYDHEINHINNGDYDSSINVSSLEYKCHRKEGED